MRNTLRTLAEYHVIPIINENDTVSTEEIKLGDNDRLAAMVAGLIQADLLIILSIVDGLLSGDPTNPESGRIPLVERYDDELLGLVGKSKSSRGTGGMKTKLDAVRTATAVGVNVIIANGKRPNSLCEILSGADVGTLFQAEGDGVSAWKRWIGYTLPRKGDWSWTKERGAPSSYKGNHCWRSALSASTATSPRARSYRWSIGTATNSRKG